MNIYSYKNVNNLTNESNGTKIVIFSEIQLISLFAFIFPSCSVQVL
jgi:hypothetical protein